MEDKELHQLIDKYLKGSASQEEVDRLHIHYRKSADSDTIWLADEEEEVKQRVFLKIKDKVSNSSSVYNYKYWLQIAAVLLIGITSFSIYSIVNSPFDSTILKVQKLPSNHHDSRYILLPDSSIVILAPGSELVYPEVFTKDERLVELKGEAYFDIKHRENHPFIIQSGKVKTTVLGTAFTIKALSSDEVEVFVNRGKVKVEDDTKELAVLTANHKLIYHPKEKNLKDRSTSRIVEDEFDWQETKMDFDELPFGNITKKLEDRYNVKIKFKEAHLREYQLSGVFSGMENLEEILTILCKTSGSSFRKIDDNIYEIKFN